MKKGITGILLGSLLFAGTALSVSAEDDKNCDDFADHNEVMAFWYENGYSAENDPHDLDRDDDGLACEVSQSEYDNYVASQEGENAEEAADEQEEAAENEEEGAALPDTASNGPLMMLFGAGVAGAGSLLLFRRKSKTA